MVFYYCYIKLVSSRRGEKTAKEEVTGLMNEMATLKLKYQDACHHLEDFQFRQTEKQTETKELLQITK